MIKKYVIIFFVLLNCSINQSYSAVSGKITILVSFDGFRFDYDDGDTLKNFQYLKKNGVSAYSLKPVFPTTTFANHISEITGMYSDNHGIIANSFINPLTNKQFSVGNKECLRDEQWFNGEMIWETARRHGIRSGSCFWAGSELDNVERKPDYLLEFNTELNYMQRIDTAIAWLNKTSDLRPEFICIYFEETDISGHTYGTDSPELRYSAVIVDSIIGYLFNELKKINLYDSTNIIITSDHGMMDFDTANTINIDSILSGFEYKIQNYGAYMMIETIPENIKNLFWRLKSSQNNFRVFLKEDIPTELHYSNHPFISPILILADPGWVLTDKYSYDKAKDIKAVHGYDNNEIKMHGIFYGMGPDFKKNFQAPTLQIIDIYPLLCKIMEITPRYNIDGRLDRIGFILKDK